ncbi:MAG: hypothetical protein JEZ00_17300 [Anaerolineaceae bacterium]|nr:hypothetical protein [Anaerolineaceae bacterium]
MPPKSRQRFNAFDDFPGNEEPIQQDQGKLSTFVQAESKTAPKLERIEHLAPSKMTPDRFQPRRLLPSGIRQRYFNGDIDCYQAAGEWLNLSKNDASYRIEVDRLLSMGGSFEEHGQIKPITGSWQSNTKGEFIFQIETGERRFWAACLNYINDQLEEEPLLRIETIDTPTRQRQVLENRHAETPSAVSQSCEIASLILAEMDIHPDTQSNDEFEYFRQARAQRMPVGLWDKIKPIMQLTRPRMVQLLNILQFPNNLLDLANRYQLPERVLREILTKPEELWEQYLRLSIQNQLTSDEIAEIEQPPTIKTATAPSKKQTAQANRPYKTAVSGIRRFANAIYEVDEFQRSKIMDDLADELVISDQASDIIPILEELIGLMRTRL